MMKTNRFILFVALIVVCSLCTPSALAADVTITVNPNNKTISIPNNFLGISIAQNSICDMVAENVQSPVFAQLFSNLSPAVLRIGGGSGENALWRPDASQCVTNTLTIGGKTFTSATINGIISLANTTNWKIIWGLPVKNPPPADIANEAAYVFTHAGSTLLAEELGNEPDGVWGTDYSGYITKWIASANAIFSKNSSIPLAGPAVFGGGGQNDFFSRFIGDEHSKIVLATRHSYPAGGRTTSPSDATDKVQAMLDTERMKNYVQQIADTAVTKAKSYNLPMRMAEMNSVSNGGTKGASDTFASALWATDYMFSLLEHGVVGVNFHSRLAANPNTTWSPQIYYSPINNASTVDGTYTPYATPEYYAMLLFKYAASNGNVLPVQLNTNYNVTAHAVVNTDGTLRVIVINKETNKAVTVLINTTQPYTNATIIRLAAPSLTTTITSPTNSTVTLGKNPVAANGTWSPQTPDTVTLNGASSTVTLEPFRAAVITYTPSPTLKPGDLNGDGKVTIADYTILKSNFGKTGAPGWIPSDINKDGKVDIFDDNIVVKNFGK